MGARHLLFIAGAVVLLAFMLSTANAQAQGAGDGPTKTAPVPFSSNGCSGFREATFFTCCFVHDFAYWSGGGRRERSSADHALRRCVQDIGRDYVRSYIAFVMMRLSLGSGAFVNDGWGRAWTGTKRGRFTALSPDERRIVDESRRQVCQGLTLDSANGQYKIDARFLREVDRQHIRPREARELCGM
jgi:hypothetical protein